MRQITARQLLLLTMAFLLSSTVVSAQRATGPDSGQVSGSTYRNEFFEFAYNIPPGWSVMEMQMPSGIRLAEKPPLDLLVITDDSGSALRIVAEDVRNVPSVRSPRDAMDKIVKLLGSTSEKHVFEGPVRKLSIGGVPFLRADYRQTIGERTNYFCTVLTMSRGFVLRFSTFSQSSDRMKQVCSSLESIKFVAKQ